MGDEPTAGLQGLHDRRGHVFQPIGERVEDIHTGRQQWWRCEDLYADAVRESMLIVKRVVLRGRVWAATTLEFHFAKRAEPQPQGHDRGENAQGDASQRAEEEPKIQPFDHVGPRGDKIGGEFVAGQRIKMARQRGQGHDGHAVDRAGDES